MSIVSLPKVSKGGPVRIIGRTVQGCEAQIRLSNGQRFTARRFFPAGVDDQLQISRGSIRVLARHDKCWIEIGDAWSTTLVASLGRKEAKLQFKEIETEAELALFDDLRKFHYRGGGGAGRTVPLIATSKVWDLPSVLGFVELSSAMIANSARKRFLDFRYNEPEGPRWTAWDRDAARQYLNIICRISRFVIHPELRGLGLAKAFTGAACQYASERWHYGGYKPRFLEITADMLRYHNFIGRNFVRMGETEGNEHRLTKDMAYLAKRASTSAGNKGMPQGGGGIMTLQRGYASQLMRFLKQHNRSLPDVIDSLRHDSSTLDQQTWEALYRLNRRPKPCYTTGLTTPARKYVAIRQKMLLPEKSTPPNHPLKTTARGWMLKDINVQATALIDQSADARTLQDAFGFVGDRLSSVIIRDLNFEIVPGKITLICGASGSGKSLLIQAVASLLAGHGKLVDEPNALPSYRLSISGLAERTARVTALQTLSDEGKTALDLKRRSGLEEFLTVTARCGLAEPQLFVRPIRSLSSGQKYRLQLALALLNRPEVLAIDNYCESLDEYTAVAVTNGLKRLSAELKIGVLLASASYDRLLRLIKPDQTILLRRNNLPVLRKARRAHDL